MLEVLQAAQSVDVTAFGQAVDVVHAACITVHGEDNCCLFYHPSHGAALAAGSGAIPSVVAKYGAIPSLADPQLAGKLAWEHNITLANNITGLRLQK